jgi:hypothetical protein
MNTHHWLITRIPPQMTLPDREETRGSYGNGLMDILEPVGKTIARIRWQEYK